MFLIMLNYLKPLKEIDAAIPAHIAYLEKYYDLGKFVLSGRKNPRTGGVILCNAEDRDEVEAIIAEDPFHIKRIAEYEIIEFMPTKCAEGLEALIIVP